MILGDRKTEDLPATTLDDLFRRAADGGRTRWRWPIRPIAKASPMARRTA